MKTGTRRIAVAFVLNVIFVTSSALAQEHALAKSGVTSVHAKSSNKEIDVVFHTVRVEKTSDTFPGIDWEAKAVTLAQMLEISVQGKRVFVPRSVFADLIDPRVASIKAQKGDFVLTIAGADGAEAYSVNVYFDATKVKRRTLSSALTPSVIAEDTHYRLTILKDE